MLLEFAYHVLIIISPDLMKADDPEHIDDICVNRISDIRLKQLQDEMRNVLQAERDQKKST